MKLRHPDDTADAVLLARFVAADDPAAFARLVERHRPLVQGVCRRVLRDHHDAEDATQATFLVLVRKASHVRERDGLAGWLCRVAHRLALRHRAEAGRRRQSEQARPLPEPVADRTDDLVTALGEELDRLPDRYRVPLLLCGPAGRTRDQAAKTLGWTPGTLKMQLERGRHLLRTRLARRGLSPPRQPN